MTISLLDFMEKYDGKYVDYDGFYGPQCVDLYRKYVEEVLGLEQGEPVCGAKEIWKKHNGMHDKFSPSEKPLAGSIAVWDGDSNNEYGHVGIVVMAGKERFWSFDQNYPLGSPCHVQGHGYNGLLGWMRKKEGVVIPVPPSSGLAKARHIYGVHDSGAEELMSQGGVEGWVVFTHALSSDTFGFDYTGISPHVPIARLNWGYHPRGTIPRSVNDDGFDLVCARWVKQSKGCHRWIIGNEPNHEQEWPYGQRISAGQYAEQYKSCRDAILSLPGHENDEVLVAAVAPWNASMGDWVHYFAEILGKIGVCDGMALHAYTHGHAADLIYSDIKMGPPYQHRHYNWKVYRDFLTAVPVHMRHLPIYITEADPDMAWMDENNGWVYAAYSDINWWNDTGRFLAEYTDPTGNDSVARGVPLNSIQAMCLYRWKNYDKWGMEGKRGVHEDFKDAMGEGYVAG